MKIVAMGDSLTEGYPYTRRESWLTYLERELQCEVLNRGLNGNLTRNMAARFKRDVLDHDPTHASILGGTNDAYAGCSLADVSSNLAEMVAMCQERGIIPILALPIPILVPGEEALLSEYRSWANDFARDKGLIRLDFYTPFQERLKADGGLGLYIDEVHPNREGYQFMGQIAIQELGAILK